MPKSAPLLGMRAPRHRLIESSTFKEVRDVFLKCFSYAHILFREEGKETWTVAESLDTKFLLEGWCLSLRPESKGTRKAFPTFISNQILIFLWGESG